MTVRQAFRLLAHPAGARLVRASVGVSYARASALMRQAARLRTLAASTECDGISRRLIHRAEACEAIASTRRAPKE